MITRAQAEALLTLAESLEACERVGANASVNLDGEFMELPGGWDQERFEYLESNEVRHFVSVSAPKPTGS